MSKCSLMLIVMMFSISNDSYYNVMMLDQAMMFDYIHAMMSCISNDSYNNAQSCVVLYNDVKFFYVKCYYVQSYIAL